MNTATEPRYRHGDPLRAVLGWRPMDTAPVTGAVQWVEVKLPDGSIDRAHFARDLSGEEQPPFVGWFVRVGSGPGYFFSEVFPTAWRPILNTL